jgi:hypothetical protein
VPGCRPARAFSRPRWEAMASTSPCSIIS